MRMRNMVAAGSAVCLMLGMIPTSAVGQAAQRRPQPRGRSAKPASLPGRSREAKLKALEAVAREFVLDSDGQTIYDKEVYDFLMHDLRLAIRCGYDLDMLVHRSGVRFVGDENKGRLFKIRNGVYSMEIGGPDPVGVMERTRYGLCTPRTAQEAFALGFVFFLTDARIESGRRMLYTIVSNPAVQYPEQRAFEVLYIKNQRDGSSRRVEMSRSVERQVNLKPEPQTRIIGLREFGDEHVGSLTLMNGPFGNAGLPYIQSNDIDLAAVWKARPRE